MSDFDMNFSLLVYQTNQTALFSMYSRLIEETSKNRLLIVCVDDAHRLDRTSLDLLKYCIHKNTKTSILFVISSRTPGVNEHERNNLEAIDELQNSLKPRSSRIEIRPLAKSYCAEIVKKVPSTAGLDQLRMNEIYNAAQGNPYAIRQALTCLDTGERIPEYPHRMLEKIFNGIYADMPESKEVIRHAAVLGSTFDLDTLAGLSNMKRSKVFDILAELGKKYKIVADLANGTTFAFDHDNTRNYVCKSIRPVISDYHETIAKFLERGNVVNPYVLAYHYSHTVHKEKTLRYMRAAASSSGKFFMDSSERLRQCLVIAQEIRLNDEEITPIKIDYADSLLEKGDVESGREILESVLSERMTLKAKVRARILLSKCHRLIGTSESGEMAIENARIATNLLDDSSTETGDAYAYLATVIDHFKANNAETKHAYMKATKCYQHCPEKLAQLQRKSGMVLESRQAIRVMGESLKTFEEYDMRIETARCCNNIGAEYFYIGDFKRAFSFLARSLEDFRKIGAYQADVPLNNMGLYYLHHGKYDKASHYFDDALEHSSETFNAIFIRMNMSTLHRKEKRLDRAMQTLLDLEESVTDYAEPTLCDYYGFNRAMAHRDLEDWKMAEQWLCRFPVNTYKDDTRLAEAKRMRAMHEMRKMQGIETDSDHVVENNIRELFNTQRPQKWFYETDYYPCDIHMWD